MLLLAMGITMTVPMVAWMRYRGHGWPASNEMAVSMLIPTAGVIGLLGAGLVEDVGTLLMIEHVVMLRTPRRGHFRHPPFVDGCPFWV